MKLLPRLLTALLLFLFASAPRRALAQGHEDAVEPRGVNLEVPEMPAGFERRQLGPVVLEMRSTLSGVFRPATEHLARDLSELSAQLGLRTLPTLRVRFVRDAEELRALAPANAPPPEYAAGVAYPSVGLALVSATEPRSLQPVRVRQVLRHELSHLLLGVATGRQPIPRWFSEGVAVVQAGEQTWERFQTLSIASWTGRLLPFEQLDRGFYGGSSVEVAYAESASAVSFLMSVDGRARFPLFVSQLGAVGDADQAARRTYGRTLGQLEAEWRSANALQFALAPIFAGSGALGLAGTILLAAAWLRKRRREGRIRARWATEEARLKALQTPKPPEPRGVVLAFPSNRAASNAAPPLTSSAATNVGVIVGIIGPAGLESTHKPSGTDKPN